jgi:lipopolysaccharide/colanic/teichoic acid biosynthesis glycosyltransferase
MTVFASKSIAGHAGTFEPSSSKGAAVSRLAPSQSGLRLVFVGARPAMPVAGAALRCRLWCKRCIDVVFSSIALIVLAPLLLVVAIAIALTSAGSVLFRQTREGLDGAPIEIYKFRSLSDVGDSVTPVGSFLRRTSIDELPQLYNVLKGEMSLVGPRPHVPHMMAAGRPYAELVPHYHARHTIMKPGLTGWAQVNGLRGGMRDAQAARARIDHDLAYIQNFSLLLDFRIMLLTLLREFPRGSGK